MPPNASSADPAAPLQGAASPTFLRKLERLRINVGGATGQNPGNNPVARATQATGLEVAKHQRYVPGDDLRYIDWNVYARLDERLVKTFRAEREAPLHLLIDASASMGVPQSDGKLRFAAALALSLAFISLRQRDPVRCAALQDERGTVLLAPLLRHPQRLPVLQHALAGLVARGPTRFVEGIEAYMRTTQIPGVTVVLSDFLVSPKVYQDGLERLRAGNHTVAALRLIGPIERRPRADTRRVRIHDIESGKQRQVEITSANLDRYRQALDEHTRELRTWCESRAIPFAIINTDAALEQCMLSDLPRAGLLR
jgi:uncharacterized protein (DUF58 family)